MGRLKQCLGTGVGVVLVVAAGKLLLHLATASRYGYFGDELYFLACGEHLDWGYVDQPPLVGLVAWLVRHTLGTSLLAIRSVSALAGAALVVLTGLLAREMGGGRFAMGLSALASALAFVYVVMHYLFTMNALEPLFWTGCAFLVVRIVKTGDQRLCSLRPPRQARPKQSTRWRLRHLGFRRDVLTEPRAAAFRKPCGSGWRCCPRLATWSGTSARGRSRVPRASARAGASSSRSVRRRILNANQRACPFGSPARQLSLGRGRIPPRGRCR
jgi:hypothetical protein